MPALNNFQWTPDEQELLWKNEEKSSAASRFQFILAIFKDFLRNYERCHIAETALAALLVCLIVWKLWIRRQERSRGAVKANRRRLSSGSLRTTHTKRHPASSFDSAPSDGQAQQRDAINRRARSRSGSHSSLDMTINNEGEHDDLFELLGVERSAGQDNPMHRIKYYGPAQFSIVYESLAPPPSWLEVSRQVIPPDKHFRLQRYLALTISESSTLAVHHATSGHTAEAALAIAQRPVHATTPYALQRSQERDPPVELPLEHISLQPVPPMQSGVIQIYVKDASARDKNESMEHTLPSAALAAQLQMDILALQVLGPAIYNMFQALQLIHQGSIAYKGKEFVWHDDEAIGNDATACDDNLLAQCCYGIAWDDCLRCLGSTFPSLRLRLEALWWKHATEHGSSDAIKIGESSSSDVGSNGANDEGLTAFKLEYVKKRLLIGPVDFFRLFVPQVSETTVPRNHSSKLRVEQMFRWRKRVARASVLVNAYCDARHVVNRGWVMSRPVPDNYWRRRMAFDDNTDNIRWDVAPECKHTYYESTVSRDVVCQVRGSGYAESRSNCALSLTQGYSLIGIHTCKVSHHDHEPMLRPDEDPVQAFPSLRALIERNAGLDFFVSCTHVEAKRLWHVAVFVRSLPAGVDPSFDSAVQRYKDGGPVERDNQLEVILHLGTTRDRLHWKTWLGVNLMSLLSVLSVERESPPPQKNVAGERTPLTALRVSACGKVSHFGGSLQRQGLPTNYVAHIASLSSKKALTFAMRTVLLFVESSVFEHDVLDVSVVLAGASACELPERVLGTYRLVQMKSVVALPMSSLFPKGRNELAQASSPSREMDDEPSGVTLFLKLFVTDPFLAAVDPMSRLLTSPGRERLPADATMSLDVERQTQRASLLVSSEDPLEQAVNEMVNVLENVRVPVRRDQASSEDFLSGDVIDGLDRFVSVPAVQMVTRGDIRRFFVASQCSHSKAAMRIVEMLAWRGRTFPVDKRSCRVELQNGQFFQQGCDKKGNPVFYFRSMLLGPWRKDENAAIAAVVARFDQAMQELDRGDVSVRCTLVVSLGKPHKNKERKTRSNDVTNGANDDGVESRISSVDVDGSESISDGELDSEAASAYSSSNPRVEPDEIWSLHSNKRLARTLINVLLDYYPERLHRAFVVVAHGNTAYARTAVGGLMRLSKYVRSPRTRDKVKFLIRYSDLREYIDPDELVSFCGGHAAIQPAAYECE